MSENVKPRFEVHQLDGEGTRRIAKPKTDKEGKLLGGFEFVDKKVPAGWMVYFPNGSSIHVWTQEEMERQGFLSAPDLVNMETGDLMGKSNTQSLKDRSIQKERATKGSRVHHVTN